ncbi:hypothetical protein AN396_00385 [Candidatus Epulonipiscium fishelsonii]|uniref:Uncharacterized protein n=1 Tax=Candidatus Epulonipiscium fishelsonii TaxID=77094 RepID=A0ACC8XFN1_9FIRM|nr:hypothetical protein AN396_00385 [Epulopiscium sp. SCG-B11WGA-EpuloA1]
MESTEKATQTEVKVEETSTPVVESEIKAEETSAPIVQIEEIADNDDKAKEESVGEKSNMVDDVKYQENTLVLEKFDNEIANEIGTIIAELAKERNHVVTVSVRLANGLTVYQRSMNGAILSGETWLEAKHNTVMTRSISTLGLFASGKTLESLKLNGNYTQFGGGFPLKVKNAGIVGSVLVSGLYHVDDHNLIIEGLNAYLGTDVPLINEDNYK